MAAFDEYITGLAGDIDSARELGVPVVLLGHSMGGLISVLYAQSRLPQPDLLVLSTPAIDAELPRVKLLLAQLLVRVVPRLALPNGLKADQMSHDPDVGVAYFNDPLNHHKTTVKLGIELVEAMERSRNGLAAITAPTLVIHGGEDTVVPPQVSAPFGDLNNAQRIVFEGGAHESFNEGAGEVAIATVADWIDAQL